MRWAVADRGTVRTKASAAEREDQQQDRRAASEVAFRVPDGQQRGVADVLVGPGPVAADQRADADRVEHRRPGLVGVDEDQRQPERGDPDDGDGDDAVGPHQPDQRDDRGQQRHERHQTRGRDGEGEPGDEQRHDDRGDRTTLDRPLDEHEHRRRPDEHPRFGPDAEVVGQPPREVDDARQPRDEAREACDPEAGQDGARQQEPPDDPERGRGQAQPERRRVDAGDEREDVVEPAERRLGGVQPAEDGADLPVLGARPDDARDVAVVDGQRTDHLPQQQPGHDADVDEPARGPAGPRGCRRSGFPATGCQQRRFACFGGAARPTPRPTPRERPAPPRTPRRPATPSAIFSPPTEVWNRVSATAENVTPAADGASVNAPATAGRTSPSSRATSRGPLPGAARLIVVASIPLTRVSEHGPPRQRHRREVTAPDRHRHGARGPRRHRQALQRLRERVGPRRRRREQHRPGSHRAHRVAADRRRRRHRLVGQHRDRRRSG